MSMGEIKEISEARRIIAEGENLKKYEPVDTDKWAAVSAEYEKYIVG